MFHPYAHLPVGTAALFQGPVPTSFDGWMRMPEFQYPLGLACLIILGLLIYRSPDIAAWWRGRHKEILRPIDLEQIIMGTPLVILDLRPPEEFNGPKGHIRGAINLPVDLLSRRLHEVAKDKRHLVVLVDRKDILSHKVAERLKADGYLWVRVLRGGMRAWRAQALPVAVSGQRG